MEGEGYRVVYARSVVDFLLEHVESRRVYERIDSYREVLKAFPNIGAEYHPYYSAAAPPFPCRYIPVLSTPFTLYYAVDENARTVNVFAIEYQRSDPDGRFAS